MRLFLLLVAIGWCSGRPQSDEYFRKPEKIIKSSSDVGKRLGNYEFTYETEGGILQREVGKRKYEGTDAETQLIQGSVQYNAPDGTPVAISWTADEFGTQVSGTHLPTPPPIPPEIQRALDWLAKQPSTEEPDYDNGPPAPATTAAPRRPVTSVRPPPPPPPAPVPIEQKPVYLKKQTFNKPLIPVRQQQQQQQQFQQRQS